MKKIRNIPPRYESGYRQLWRIVEGAVADAFNKHPDYVSSRRRLIVQRSITKRVVGSVLGFAEQNGGESLQGG